MFIKDDERQMAVRGNKYWMGCGLGGSLLHLWSLVQNSACIGPYITRRTLGKINRHSRNRNFITKWAKGVPGKYCLSYTSLEAFYQHQRVNLFSLICVISLGCGWVVVKDWHFSSNKWTTYPEFNPVLHTYTMHAVLNIYKRWTDIIKIRDDFCMVI